MSKQRNIVVIGANGDIGSETCRRLSYDGDRVTLAGRNEEALQALGLELGAPFALVDATSIESVESCLRTAAEPSGRIDAVVNCAGSVLLKPAHLTKTSEWDATIAVNLTSAFATIRGAYRLMKEHGGSIVLMSSAAARTGLANHEAIAAAKAGVIGLMQSAAATYATSNIRINAVAPGLVKTKLTERIWSKTTSASASLAMHALGRLGEPSDVASMIHWLLCEENSWISGQVFGVDGGLATLRSASRS